MRHDPASAAVVVMLKALKMYGMVRQLHRGDFIDGGDNVVLIAGPCTGKSHVATALGI